MKKLVIGLLTVPFFSTASFAQYVGQGSYGPQQPQYNGPSFFQGSSGPVVVPPTVIMPPGPNRCRTKRVSLFLVFDMESGDC